MKALPLILLLLAMASFATLNAQLSKISGTVIDSTNSGVGGATIQIKNGNILAQADTIGHFQIQASIGTAISVTAVGFFDTSIVITTDTPLLIILKTHTQLLGNVVVSKKRGNSIDYDSVVQAQYAQQVMSDGFAELVLDVNGQNKLASRFGTERQAAGTQVGGGFSRGAMIPIFHPVQETRGSRYLLKNWMPGSVTNQNNHVIQNNTYLFNFDKIAGNLLVTQDLQHYITLDKPQIKSFTLISGNQVFQFECVPVINNNVFFQVITKGAKYAVYEMTTTRFEKNNYVSTGLTESGHDYDEYSDQNTYFLVDVKANEAKEITIRKKALRELFAADEQKLHKYFSQHADDDIDLNYITGLVDFLNN